MARSLGFGLFFLTVFCLSACTVPRPTEEEMQANREKREARLELAEVQERAKLEEALLQDDTLTVKFEGGSRLIVTDVDLNTDEWCANRLASRGAQRHNDYWLEYDRLATGPKYVCQVYLGIKSVRAGDARLCEGLGCIFD